MQLAEPVLDRRAGHRDAVTRLQAADRARLLGLDRLDVLRLVENQAVPLDRGQRIAIAQSQRIGGDDQIRRARRARKRAPPEPFAAMMHMHPQAGSEPLRLALPVAGHRHRADQQRRTHPPAPSRARALRRRLADRRRLALRRRLAHRRRLAVRWRLALCRRLAHRRRLALRWRLALRRPPALRRRLALGKQQGEQLNRLAQPHVVGQAGAEADARQERQPGKAALLVGPQLALECGRRRNPLELAVAVGAQQAPEPARRIELDRQRVGGGLGIVQTQPGAQQVARRRPPALAPVLQEAQRRIDVVGPQGDPASPSLHERQLQRGQRPQLGERERRVADRDLPLIGAQAVQAEQPRRLLPLARGLHAQLHPQSLPPPGWYEYRKASLLQRRSSLAQEAVSGVRAQLHLRRRNFPQRWLELRPEPQRVAEAAQQALLRVLEHAPQRGQTLAARPHIGRRNEHARVLLGLQQDLHAPRPFPLGLGLVLDRRRIAAPRG